MVLNSCIYGYNFLICVHLIIDKQQIEEKFTGLLDQFYIEIKALETLSHPNIISLIDVFETPSKIYIVMEKMSGGELFDYVVEKSKFVDCI